ncbi:MAG: 16S rRNA (adenine(1518)-N(6)/adenine(1519)-N(6))-dimethyltransferase RsmA [Verrucomicrobiota bacterium]
MASDHADDPSLGAGPLSPRATRALLEALGHRPRKPLGQNFLVDGNIVRKSLELAAVQAGDRVVEIGPGLGTLSGALLAAGAEVHAVELDPTLAAHLRATLGERLVLLEGDAVEHPRAGLPEDSAKEGFKVVANLPYAITSPWMDGLLAGPLPERMVLMMQKEASDRLTAEPGSKQFSAIAIFLQSAYKRLARHKVARQCFHPAPGVDSVLLALERRSAPLLFAAETRTAIRRLFGQRRKQVGALVRGDPVLEAWLAGAVSAGLAQPTDRPEAISLAAWQRLAH